MTSLNRWGQSQRNKWRRLVTFTAGLQLHVDWIV